MPSESIKILIEADDLASATAKQSGKAIEQSIQGIKDVGGKAKASTEFIGILAGQLGGSEFATAAQGLAGITEKVGQFSEVLKTGTAGALAFSLGMQALVGVISFQVGKAIGEMIFGVDDVAGRMKIADEDSKRFANSMVELSNVKIGNQMEDITLIRDPEEQQRQAVKLFEQIGTQVDDAVKSFQYYSNEADKLREAGGDVEIINDLQNEAAGYMQVAQSLRANQNELSKKYSEHARQVQLIKQQQAAEDAAAAKKAQIDASVVASLRGVNYQYTELTKGAEAARRAQLQDQGVGEADIKRILFAEQQLKLEKDLADAKQKAQDAEKQRLEKIEDLRKSELSRLEEQKIALEQGQEAAHSYRLQQQGLDKATADAIAAAQAQADAMASTKDDKTMEAAGPVTSKESRLMTRGRQDDSQKKIEQNTAQTVDKLDKVKEAIEGLRTSLQSGPGITFSGTGP
jgi:hypothetical protein